MEKNKATTGIIRIIGYTLTLGLYREDGEEDGN